MTSDQLSQAASISGAASIGSGFGTFIMGTMGFLNEYGIAVGAVCAVMTMIANIAFKWLERRDRLQKK